MRLSNNDYHTPLGWGINQNLRSGSKYSLRKFNGVIWRELNGEIAALISKLIASTYRYGLLPEITVSGFKYKKYLY
jgi:hypothetical protein